MPGYALYPASIAVQCVAVLVVIAASCYSDGSLSYFWGEKKV